MNRDLELNRLQFMILDTLYESDCKDHFHSMTIIESQKQNDMAKLDQLLQAVDDSSDDIVESRYDKQSQQSDKIMSINKVG